MVKINVAYFFIWFAKLWLQIFAPEIRILKFEIIFDNGCLCEAKPQFTVANFIFFLRVKKCDHDHFFIFEPLFFALVNGYAFRFVFFSKKNIDTTLDYLSVSSSSRSEKYPR